ncbi:MAG TPA: gliding motility protein [Thermoanaerobaculia bacterium]
MDALALRQAQERLQAFISAEGGGDRSEAFVRLVRIARTAVAASPEAMPLLTVIQASPELVPRFQGALATLLGETDAATLFGETGIPAERGFFAELADRIAQRLVPAPRNDRDLSHILRRLYRTPGDVDALRELDPRVVHGVGDLFAGAGSEAWAPVRRACADGFRLLASRVASHGLARELRARSTPCRVAESPFYRLARIADALLDAWEAGGETAAAAAAFRKESGECRKETRAVQRHLENAGVSVRIVFDLEVIERCLTRMALMADVIEAAPGIETSRAAHRLFVRLATLAQQESSIAHLVKWNLHLLDRKIVERSGETGEHYVAADRKDYRHIWAAAAGGGALTVLTAAIKMAVHELHLAPFPESFLYGLNYAVSFLALQAFGLVLATKQPAMTAATLAKIIQSSEGEDRLERVATFFSRLTSSQLAAAAANVLVVGAGAAVFDGLWRLVAGRAYLDPEVAAHTFETLSPLDSGTVFFAALTGVLLWMGGVAGGWFENWVTVHRLPEALAGKKPGGTLTKERLRRIGDALSRNAAGWGTNVALGFLLGFAPAVGRFFGIPFDVRHVTLSTGTLALAAAGLGERWFLGGWFLRALGGIAVMFVLNLTVAFTLSLVNAARAFEMTNADLWGVLKHVFAHFRKNPLSFVLPPKADAAEK